MDAEGEPRRPVDPTTLLLTRAVVSVPLVGWITTCVILVGSTFDVGERIVWAFLGFLAIPGLAYLGRWRPGDPPPTPRR